MDDTDPDYEDSVNSNVDKSGLVWYYKNVELTLGGIMEDNHIFREKSLERIKSPENLNEYIRVANPGMWLSLGAVLCILIGFIVWGSVANLDTIVLSAVVVEDSKGLCYFPEDVQQYLIPGMNVSIEGHDYKLGNRTPQAVMLDKDEGDEALLLHLMEEDDVEDGWFDVYEIDNVKLEDGAYTGESIVDSVTPISFFFDEKTNN